MEEPISVIDELSDCLSTTEEKKGRGRRGLEEEDWKRKHPLSPFIKGVTTLRALLLVASVPLGGKGPAL